MQDKLIALQMNSVQVLAYMQGRKYINVKHSPHSQHFVSIFKKSVLLASVQKPQKIFMLPFQTLK